VLPVRYLTAFSVHHQPWPFRLALAVSCSATRLRFPREGARLLERQIYRHRAVVGDRFRQAIIQVAATSPGMRSREIRPFQITRILDVIFHKNQSSLNLATRTFPQISSALKVGANPLLPRSLESASVPDLPFEDRSGTPRKSRALPSAKWIAQPYRTIRAPGLETRRECWPTSGRSDTGFQTAFLLFSCAINDTDTVGPLNALRGPEIDTPIPLIEHIFHACRGRIPTSAIEIAVHDDRIGYLVNLL
jgi:hypothetical protein